VASHSLPIALRQATKRSQAHASVRVPTLRTASIILIAVLILFRWLHLILALDITSTGRQIQKKTMELHQLERANAELQLQVAEGESPGRLSEEAARLGYQPRPPLYISVDQPMGSSMDKAKLGQESTQAGPPFASAGSAIPEGFARGLSLWLATESRP